MWTPACCRERPTVPGPAEARGRSGRAACTHAHARTHASRAPPRRGGRDGGAPPREKDWREAIAGIAMRLQLGVAASVVLVATASESSTATSAHLAAGEDPDRPGARSTTGGAQRTISELSCTVDDNCSLNGICHAGICKCFAPWSGSSCGVLDELPGPRTAAYGRNGNGTGGTADNRQSIVPATWGASVLSWAGQTHMFVSEMTAGCGLSAWGSNTQIVHAMAKNPLGPFARQDDALGPESTNPAVIADTKGQALWLFHIGAGDNSTKGQKHCSSPPSPGPALAAATGAADVVAHVSTAGPAGPWTPRALGAFPCNNPAPALAADGTGRLLCNDSPRHWSIHVSKHGLGGPWMQAGTIQTVVPGTRRRDAAWEDPFLWQDARGHWHALSHVYTAARACGNSSASSITPECNYISGHLFSRNSINWTVSDVEPYSFNISYSDGSSAIVATRERPKLLFDLTTKEPTHIYTAVANLPEASACTHCDAKAPAGACIMCKITPPFDRHTYTQVRPLRTAP